MKILFVCVANSIRSQIAEGLARSILGDRAEIESAGISASHVHPMAIEVLKEVGVDISRHRSKSWVDLDPSFLRELDYVIVLCEQKVGPPEAVKAQRLHWPLPDPSGALSPLQGFRAVRNDLQKRIEALAKGIP